jgi:mycothiol synthase
MALLRPLQEIDIDAVLSVYREAWGSARPIAASDIRSWLRNPEVDPETLRVLEIGGRIVGYGDVTVADHVVALEVAAPGYWDAFLSWAEEVGRTAGATRVRVLNYAGDALPKVAASRGYFLWRSNYRMRIDFGPVRPDLAPVPDGATLRTYVEGDTEALVDRINEIFAPETDPFFSRMTRIQFTESYVRDPGMEPSLWLLAHSDDGDLAGFSLGFSEWHGDAGVGEIRSVGVRSSWRRRGLGEALVRATFRALHARGLRSATLGVDASNEAGAVRLYERVGMRVVARGDNWALDLHRVSNQACQPFERP